MQQNASLQEKHWKIIVQFNKEFSDFTDLFLGMMEQCQSMGDGYLGQITLARYRIGLNPPNAPPIHSTSHRTGPNQRNLEREETDEMGEAFVTEPAVTECS